MELGWAGTSHFESRLFNCLQKSDGWTILPERSNPSGSGTLACGFGEGDGKNGSDMAI